MRSTLWRAGMAHVLFVSFLLGMTAAVLLGVQQVLESSEQTLRRSLSGVAFLQAMVSDSDAQALEDKIREADPQIIGLTFISKAAALADAQQDPGLSRSLLLLKENPLPASYTIRWSDSAWLTRAEPGQTLRVLPAIQEIRWDAQAQSSFRIVHEWRVWVGRLSLGVLAVLLAWSFVGLYRFLSSRFSIATAVTRVLGGLVGGGAALLTWSVALQHVGTSAALCRPNAFSWLPLLTGAIAGISSFDEGDPLEN